MVNELFLGLLKLVSAKIDTNNVLFFRGIIPSHGGKYTLQHGAGNLFEVISFLFFQTVHMWPIVKTAAGFFVSGILDAKNRSKCIEMVEKTTLATDEGTMIKL